MCNRRVRDCLAILEKVLTGRDRQPQSYYNKQRQEASVERANGKELTVQVAEETGKKRKADLER